MKRAKGDRTQTISPCTDYLYRYVTILLIFLKFVDGSYSSYCKQSHYREIKFTLLVSTGSELMKTGKVQSKVKGNLPPNLLN